MIQKTIKFDPQKLTSYNLVKVEKLLSSFPFNFIQGIILPVFVISLFLLFIQWMEIPLFGEILPVNFTGLFMIIFSITSLLGILKLFYQFKLTKLAANITPQIAENIKNSDIANTNLASFLDFSSVCTISKSMQKARKNGYLDVDTYHLLFVILDNPRVDFVLQKGGIEKNILKEKIEKKISSSKRKKCKGKICFTSDLLEVIKNALNQAVNKEHKNIQPPDLFYGLCIHDEILKKLLFEIDLEIEDIENIIYWEDIVYQEEERRKQILSPENLKRSGGIGKDWASGYAPNLKQYCRELKKALETHPHIIGLNKEIKEVERILTKSQKNDVILIGDPGVGKSVIVQGLAERISEGRTIGNLAYKHILQLDIGLLLSGAGQKGEAEKRLNIILSEAQKAGNIILYINGIHNLASHSDKAGSIDATAILTPYIQSPKLRVIGTTSQKEYHQYIESKPSFASVLERVEVKEPEEKETIRILEDVAPYQEKRTGIIITYKAIREITRLAYRYIKNQPFPKKAIDILDEVCVYVATNTSDKFLLPEHVAKIISDKTNIPIGRAGESEKKKLLNLEELLHKRIIGQDEAITVVSDAMRRIRAGLHKGKRPAGAFLFMGPTGVGKTELSKTLAHAYFGSEKNMIRLDMSEYKDLSSINRLIGAPPGYQGSDVGGQLTEQVKNNPFSLILLDEFEKAHPNILDLFLQVFEDGRLTDSSGDTIDFTNCIIIATSNAGAELIRQNIKENVDITDLNEKLLDHLQSQGKFKPELLNRFDAIVVFKPLSPSQIVKIAELLIKELSSQLEENQDIILKFQPKTLEKMAELGYDPTLGARPLRRLIQDKVESVLAKKLLSGDIKRGDTVELKPEDIE